MINNLVTIIIPAYNHEKYITQTLEAIINQTYKDIELIILNDGSSDKTHEKIMEMQEKLNERFVRYLYVTKKNEGICKTYNEGLALSRGEFIIPFSSDDIMLPKRVEKQVEFFRTHEDYGLVYTDGYVTWSEEQIDINAAYPDWGKFSNILEFEEGNQLEWVLKHIFTIPTPTTCITRHCYDVVGNYDEGMTFEDPDMHIRIAKQFKIGYIKEILTLKRTHSTNTSRNVELATSFGGAMFYKYMNGDLLTQEQKDILMNTFRGVTR